ncbi:MAG: hypothetical protein IT208_03270 [Chthonomonadales bacterium]|nr:hypothetical protein [Chthonomonadales bacterium]
MTPSARRLLACLAALAVLAGLVALLRVARRFDPSAGWQRAAGPVDVALRAQGALMIARVEGKPRWRMEAATITVRPAAPGDLDSYVRAEFRGIRRGVVYRDGRPQARFSAASATYDQPRRRIEALGAIRVRSRQGDRLEADRCAWTEQEDAVVFPAGAHGRLQGCDLSAPNVTYALRERRVQCPQGAEVRARGGLVRAGSLDWDVDAELLVCTGAVATTGPAMSVVARRAVVDLKRRTVTANEGRARVRIDSGEALRGPP